MKKQYAIILAALLAGTTMGTSGFAAGEDQSTRGYGAGSGAMSDQSQQSMERQRQSATGQQVGQQSEFKAVADLKGMTIQNMQGQQLGQIDQVLVDMNEGRLAFVVLTGAETTGATAGATAAGAQNYIVPWQMVRTSPQEDGLMLNVSSLGQLRPIPAGEQIEQTLTRQTGSEIFQFYGIAPYWEESGQQPRMDQPMPQDRMHQQMMERMHQQNQQQPMPQAPR